MPRASFHAAWPDAKILDLNKFILESDCNFTEIAVLFDLQNYQVLRYAKRILSPEAYAKKKARQRTTHPKKVTKTLENLGAQLQLLKAQQLSIAIEIKHLQEERELLAIRFTADGDDVTVFGVTDDAAGITASYHDWLRWLNHSGGAKLRTFIEGTYNLKGCK
jgi:hypothetical protein